MSTTQNATAEIDEDAPVCPRCGYLLIGLVSRTCPECGTPLADDLSIYRQRKAPWSSEWPLRFCGSPRRVTVRKAARFAALVTVGGILLWPAVRSALILCVVRSQWWANFAARLRRLGQLPDLEAIWLWQTGALARWWVLFGVLALVLHHVSDRRVCLRVHFPPHERPCRLLLMAPWFVLVEILFFVGVWLTEPKAAPEPGTLFVIGGPWTEWLRAWLRPVWLVRGVAPTLLVGAVFFRAVMCWRWWPSVCACILLVPFALCLSTAWTYCYMEIVARL